MSVYNGAGSPILSVYNSSGNIIQTAYNSNGDIVYSGGSENFLRICTYNVGQWYIGNSYPIPTDFKTTYADLQTTIFNHIQPDVCFMQEATTLFCEDGALAETFLSTWLDNVEITRGSIGYQAHMLATNGIEIEDYQALPFINAVGNYPGYETAYITVNGKRIFLVNTHISTNQEYQELQCAEMLELISDKESFILCGDFNTVIYSDKTQEDWTNCIKPFADAGYNLANGGKFGVFPTYWRTSDPNPSDGYTPATDMIITSSDIEIVNVYTDSTKLFDTVTKDKIDHIPLVAEVRLTQ